MIIDSESYLDLKPGVPYYLGVSGEAVTISRYDELGNWVPCGVMANGEEYYLDSVSEMLSPDGRHQRFKVTPGGAGQAAISLSERPFAKY